MVRNHQLQLDFQRFVVNLFKSRIKFDFVRIKKDFEDTDDDFTSVENADELFFWSDERIEEQEFCNGL